METTTLKRQITIIGTIIILLSFSACSKSKDESKENTKKTSIEEPHQLTIKQANNLAELPLNCMQKEYPNKLGQTLGGKEDIGEPHELHPAFYGCFDWHSSVHGHWSLVRLLKEFPNLEKTDTARIKLKENITKENIRQEVKYFKEEPGDGFERTYGWAWLLKLAEELHTWDDPLARKLENNLQPLTNLIANRFIEYLPKLNYPIRVGEHSNTAFGLSFAWDYAKATEHEELMKTIESRAKEFYLDDTNCPFGWEPSGHDFLSPCLEEIDIMRRILSKEKFNEWITKFAPELKSEGFKMEPGKVSDRSDGKLVHLDGLNFSRAWVFYGLASQYPEYRHLISVANEHIKYSLPNLMDDSYEGGHWLGSFAIYALTYNSDENLK